jgi:predicted RNA binding protein YcfA (HicA-like mRNA interferase family)
MAKKFREVRRALSDAGWTVVRQAASHETWRSPDGASSVTVAGKDSDTFQPGRSSLHAGRPDWSSCDEEYLVIYERAEDGG